MTLAYDIALDLSNEPSQDPRLPAVTKWNPLIERATVQAVGPGDKIKITTLLTQCICYVILSGPVVVA